MTSNNPKHPLSYWLSWLAIILGTGLLVIHFTFTVEVDKIVCVLMNRCHEVAPPPPPPRQYRIDAGPCSVIIIQSNEDESQQGDTGRANPNCQVIVNNTTNQIVILVPTDQPQTPPPRTTQPTSVTQSNDITVTSSPNITSTSNPSIATVPTPTLDQTFKTIIDPTSDNKSIDQIGRTATAAAPTDIPPYIPPNTPTDIPPNTPTDIPPNTPTDIPPNTPTPRVPEQPNIFLQGVNDVGSRGLQIVNIHTNPQEYTKYKNCGNLDGEGGDYSTVLHSVFIITNATEGKGPAYLNKLIDPATCSMVRIGQLTNKGEGTAADIQGTTLEFWAQDSGLWSYDLITRKTLFLGKSTKNVEGLARIGAARYVAINKAIYSARVEGGEIIFTKLIELPINGNQQAEALEALPAGTFPNYPGETLAVGIDGSNTILVYTPEGQLVWQIAAPFEDLETFWWMPESTN